MNKDTEEVWLFKLFLESDNGEELHFKNANELMDLIILWAEKNGCQIGGGYRKPNEKDLEI